MSIFLPMKSLPFFILLILFVSPAWSQKQIDSLQIELRKSGLPDSSRVDIFNDLSFYYAGIDPKIGLSYSDSAFSLAKGLGWEARATTAVNNKGVNYWYQGEDSLALQAYQTVLAAHQKTGNRKGQASATNNIALIRYNQGDYRGALENHENATVIFQELGLRKNILNSQMNTGVVFLALADYPKALEYFLKALSQTEESDTWERGNLFTNLGLVYKNLNELEDSEAYHRKAIEHYRKEGYKQMEASSMGNLGAILQIQGKNEEAENLFFDALKLNKEIGNKRRIASDFTALGSLFAEIKDFVKAKSYLDSAANFYSGIGEKLALSTVLLQLASLEKGGFSLENLSKALELEQKALTLAQETESLEAQRSAWKALAETQKARGAYRASLEAYQNFQAFQDSIFNNENEKKLLSLRIGYEFETREKKLTAEFESEKQLLQLEKESERLRASLYLIGIGVVLLIGGGVFWGFRYQAKNKRLKLESEFRAQMAELELKALKAQMNPHFIFNALSSISNFLLKNQAEEADRYLTRFSRLIRRILEYSEVKEISLSEEISLLQDYISIEAMRLGKEVDFEIQIGEGVDQTRLMIPPLLLQPLVENSIWHGIAHIQESGLITLKVHQQENSCLLVLRDNGSGMKEFVEIPEKHQSMGMNLVKNRLETLNLGSKNSPWSIFWENLSPGFEVRLTLSQPNSVPTL
ncbi:tetratricopeptide repeat-containing sensor histidine kinase [Algoriphagus boritolerans]|uniref:Tetratricopeptide repeat-containing protein n=1 Tax=Algoriphagus boritolerans DSM 17298 = JCM 18970 TaxID=1120964 RepID=A0A1H5ZIR6_9BACT|nr:tetratricopeptide repeat protein [Algoriphagus boritolerans]SEG35296.1 Tetratricopeptide repeat-containing protein [Algoriphagus boritolerans DSM 17298 = JCM 18970]